MFQPQWGLPAPTEGYPFAPSELGLRAHPAQAPLDNEQQLAWNGIVMQSTMTISQKDAKELETAEEASDDEGVKELKPPEELSDDEDAKEHGSSAEPPDKDASELAPSEEVFHDKEAEKPRGAEVI